MVQFFLYIFQVSLGKFARLTIYLSSTYIYIYIDVYVSVNGIHQLAHHAIMLIAGIVFSRRI